MGAPNVPFLTWIGFLAANLEVINGRRGFAQQPAIQGDGRLTQLVGWPLVANDGKVHLVRPWQPHGSQITHFYAVLSEAWALPALRIARQHKSRHLKRIDVPFDVTGVSDRRVVQRRGRNQKPIFAGARLAIRPVSDDAGADARGAQLV